MKLAAGADLLIWSYTTPLNDLDMRAYLNAEMEKANPLVRGFSCMLILCIYLLPQSFRGP